MHTLGTGGGRTLIAIVYHSAYGHTRRQAEAVRSGVQDIDGAEALLVPVENVEQNWDRLMDAEALIFGTPTYMGAASAAFKAFQEATSRAVMSKGYRWKDKLAAGFTNSGAHAGDKLSTLIQLALFAAQHGMHWVNLDLPPGNNSASGSEADPNRLGFWLGAGAQSNTARVRTPRRRDPISQPPVTWESGSRKPRFSSCAAVTRPRRPFGQRHERCSRSVGGRNLRRAASAPDPASLSDAGLGRGRGGCRARRMSCTTPGCAGSRLFSA
ncbi:multimeric flavodoxin WrbA [Bradyrhizobium sp. USDA 4518]|nr:multimeric flavodoxin WrbA [Bradyrhizobium sp. USDA 4545]MCP1922406.1 multimeric flavodoxin WrbA [Bradyrhizobium sp. USDA 4532]